MLNSSHLIVLGQYILASNRAIMVHTVLSGFNCKKIQIKMILIRYTQTWVAQTVMFLCSYILSIQPCLVPSCGELLNSPRQGSFFTKNSSRAIQPPPTRTITVLRKIRTRRSCWESPNCGGTGEGNREDVWKHWPVWALTKGYKLCNTGNQTGLENHVYPINWFIIYFLVELDTIDLNTYIPCKI